MASSTGIYPFSDVGATMAFARQSQRYGASRSAAEGEVELQGRGLQLRGFALIGMGWFVALGCISVPEGPAWLGGDEDAADVGSATDAGDAQVAEGAEGPLSCPAPPSYYHRVLASGEGHVCLIRDGKLSCWGGNGSGQLGVDSEAPNLTTPSEVVGGQEWVHVAAGGEHTCALTAEAALYCWGKNNAGQLGIGTDEASSIPVVVAPKETWSHVACDGSSTCAISSAGALYCWGSNSEGQLGVGEWTGPDEWSPRAAGEVGSTWLMVELGLAHGCALGMDGSLWCWAGSENGEAGLGSESAPHAPTRLDGDTCWRELSLSMHGSLVLSGEGEAFMFGLDTYRRSGVVETQLEPCASNPESLCATTPTALDDPGPWADVTLGWFHGCGIKEDGTLWGWGGNQDTEGPFGVKDSAVFPPVEVTIEGAQLPFKRLVTGQNHTCALDAAGDVWCAGRNGNGELGRGFSGPAQSTFGKVQL